MKLWIDDVRPTPDSYRGYKSVDADKCAIRNIERNGWTEVK